MDLSELAFPRSILNVKFSFRVLLREESPSSIEKILHFPKLRWIERKTVKNFIVLRSPLNYTYCIFPQKSREFFINCTGVNSLHLVRDAQEWICNHFPPLVVVPRSLNIDSITSRSDLHKAINLVELYSKLNNSSEFQCKLDTRAFPSLCVRRREKKGASLIFSSGKILFIGQKSNEEQLDFFKKLKNEL